MELAEDRVAAQDDRVGFDQRPSLPDLQQIMNLVDQDLGIRKGRERDILDSHRDHVAELGLAPPADHRCHIMVKHVVGGTHIDESGSELFFRDREPRHGITDGVQRIPGNTRGAPEEDERVCLNIFR